MLKHSMAAFSLLEMLTGLAILSILLLLIWPSILTPRLHAQLRALSQRLQADIHWARKVGQQRTTEPVKVYFFHEGSTWCYRISDRAGHECASCRDMCDLAGDGRRYGRDLADYPQVALTHVTYSGNRLGLQRRRHGMSAGHVVFTAGPYQLKVTSSGYGRLSACSLASESISGLPTC